MCDVCTLLFYFFILYEGPVKVSEDPDQELSRDSTMGRGGGVEE